MSKEVGLLLLIATMLQYLTVEMTVNHLQLQIINEQNVFILLLSISEIFLISVDLFVWIKYHSSPGTEV